MKPILDSIWIAPIAGLSMVELPSVMITSRGLFGDREFTLMDTETGKKVDTSSSKWGRLYSEFSLCMENLHFLKIHHRPTERDFTIHLEEVTDGERMSVNLYGDSVSGILHSEGTEWFRSVLDNQNVQLVRRDENSRIVSRPRYQHHHIDGGFQHGCPISWHSIESVGYLQQRLGMTLPDRSVFRSNLIFTNPGASAHWEDYLFPCVTLGGDCTLYQIEAIQRCGTIDLTCGPSLLSELLKYRKGLARGKNGPAFGMYGYSPCVDQIITPGLEITYLK